MCARAATAPSCSGFTIGQIGGIMGDVRRQRLACTLTAGIGAVARDTESTCWPRTIRSTANIANRIATSRIPRKYNGSYIASVKQFPMPELTRQQKITLGEMRTACVRGLLVYCADYRGAQAVRLSADRWPDHTRLSDLEPLFVCQACGRRGADIRPDWDWEQERRRASG